MMNASHCQMHCVPRFLVRHDDMVSNVELSNLLYLVVEFEDRKVAGSM